MTLRRLGLVALVLVLGASAAEAVSLSRDCGEGGWLEVHNVGGTTLRLFQLVNQDNPDPGHRFRLFPNQTLRAFLVGPQVVNDNADPGSTFFASCRIDNHGSEWPVKFWMMGAGVVVGSLMALTFWRAVAP